MPTRRAMNRRLLASCPVWLRALQASSPDALTCRLWSTTCLGGRDEGKVAVRYPLPAETGVAGPIAARRRTGLMKIPKPSDSDRERFRSLVPDDPRIEIKP